MCVAPERKSARTISTSLGRKLMREKMKAKYIKEYIQKFFDKLAGWHLVTSQRINLFTDNFQGF